MNDDRPMTLRDVARAALDAHHGVSGRELDRLARKRGLSISYTTVNHLAAGTYKSRPSRNTLEALAELSGVPLAKVYEAAKVPMPMARLADQLPPDADLLSPAQREAVIAVVRQFAAANRALHEREDVMGNAEHPAPTSSPDIAFEGPDGTVSVELKVIRPSKPAAEEKPPPVRELPAAARTVKGGSRTRRARAQQDEVDTGSQIRDDADDLETP
jgi:hypothetical protein